MLRFIHSFITEIYIAPLQGYYSEALPTLARLKRRVLRLESNVSERILGNNLCDRGSPFHTEGPTTENARAWVMEVQAKGTKSNPCSDEQSELRPLVPGVGQQRSRREAGARPRIHLQTGPRIHLQTIQKETTLCRVGVYTLERHLPSNQFMGTRWGMSIRLVPYLFRLHCFLCLLSSA